ncbi:MAG: helix-turn-helix transcriptional regulator [Paludibacteraceae bacterium]|nr:helix-turn-helix transcriptional regulator [Paludibacteraceae bacterium]
MTTIVFYISCSLLLLLALCMLFYMIFASRKMKNKRFQLRRKSFIAFFALLAVTVTANTHIVHDGQPEILCTNAMCWEYITFVTFILLSIAHFGSDYYKSPYSWFMLLQYAVICVVGNVVSLTLDLYKPLYHYSDIIHTESFIGAFFVVREVLTIIIVTCYIFMIYMLINSYLKCFRKKKEVSTEVRKRMNDEAVSIFSYTGIMTFSMSAHFIESIWPHFVANVLLMVAVSRTYFIYNRYRKSCLQKSSEKSPAQIIAENLEILLLREENNPIFRPKANISDIANALKVSNDSFSKYLYKNLGMSFSAWVSEKKLLKCARLLRTTDMTITEVALASGYKDIQSMSKAFKLRFDESPRDFRKSLEKKQKPTARNKDKA